MTKNKNKKSSSGLYNLSNLVDPNSLVAPLQREWLSKLPVEIVDGRDEVNAARKKKQSEADLTAAAARDRIKAKQEKARKQEEEEARELAKKEKARKKKEKEEKKLAKEEKARKQKEEEARELAKKQQQPSPTKSEDSNEYYTDRSAPPTPVRKKSIKKVTFWLDDNEKEKEKENRDRGSNHM